MWCATALLWGCKHMHCALHGVHVVAKPACVPQRVPVCHCHVQNQWVPVGHTLQALRNISLIIQAHPAVLTNDVKVRARSCGQGAWTTACRSQKSCSVHCLKCFLHATNCSLASSCLQVFFCKYNDPSCEPFWLFAAACLSAVVLVAASRERPPKLAVKFPATP